MSIDEITKLSESEFNKLPFDAGDIVWVLDYNNKAIHQHEIQSVSIYLREVTYHTKPIDNNSGIPLELDLASAKLNMFKSKAEAESAFKKYLEET